jgi:hypothetical protein
LKYGDTAYNAARFHEKGQVISGVFYDLVRNYSVPAASVVDIALGLLKHLNPAGDIANLLDSALQADAELGNQYGCHLVAAAQDRGLTSKLPEGIDQTNCDQIVVRPSPTPTPTATPEVSPSPDASASTEFEKATASATAAPEARASGSAGTGSFCGVIGQKSQYGWLITLVVIGIPLVVTRLRFSTKKI